MKISKTISLQLIGKMNKAKSCFIEKDFFLKWMNPEQNGQRKKKEKTQIIPGMREDITIACIDIEKIMRYYECILMLINVVI